MVSSPAGTGTRTPPAFCKAKSARRDPRRKASATTCATSLPRARLLAASQPAPARGSARSPGTRTRHKGSVAVPMGRAFCAATWPEKAASVCAAWGSGAITRTAGWVAKRAFSASPSAGAIGCQAPAASLRLKGSPITSAAWPSQRLTRPSASNVTFIRPKALAYSQAWPTQTASPSALRNTVG